MAAVAENARPASSSAPRIPECIELTLPRETELRVHVPIGITTARLRVYGGGRGQDADAEVFGTPLSTNALYRLPEGFSFPIWSWRGCVVRLFGPEAWRYKCAYRAPQTNARAIAEYHGTIHQDREAAKSAAAERREAAGDARAASNLYSREAAPTVGPRVLVCGGASSGRHSVAATLANYAVRHPAGWVPTVADLDPQHNLCAPPGFLGVAAWEYGSTIEEGTMHLPSSLYFVGHTEALASQRSLPRSAAAEGPSAFGTVHPGLVQASLSAIKAVNARLTGHAASVVGWSGSIVVAPAIAEPHEAARHLATLINAAVVTHVLVVGDPELHAALLARFDATLSPALPKDSGVYCTAHGTTFRIDALRPSGGAVDWARPAVAAAHRTMRLRWYFNGPEHELLSLVPKREEIKLSRIDIMTISDQGGQAVPVRATESEYGKLAEKRIAGLYLQSDDVLVAPVRYPCHVDAVEGNTISLRISGMLERTETERYTLVVGDLTWIRY